MKAIAIVGVALMTVGFALSGCESGVAPSDSDGVEPVDSIEQPLDATCVDEAAALGDTDEIKDCGFVNPWGSTIRYENIQSWPAVQKDNLVAALTTWQTQFHGFITFQELPVGSNATPRVRFIDKNPYCQSPVGMTVPNGVNIVSLKGCESPPNNWTLLHELGHMLGLQHTQLRADRDRYVNIRQQQFCSVPGCPGQQPKTFICGNPADFVGYCDSVTHFANNVQRCSTTGSSADGFQIGAFDYASIEMYGSGFPGSECCVGHTLGCGSVKRNDGSFLTGGTSISPGDVSSIFELYRASQGWQIFRPIVSSDPGPSAPLNTRLRSTVDVDGSPALARWGASNGVIALVKGTDGHIYSRTNNIGAINWAVNFWTDRGGDFFGDPAAASWDTNRLDVVGLGQNGEIWHLWYLNGTWGSAWSSLGRPPGSAALSSPTIASWGPNRLDVFVRAGTALYQKSWTGSAWTSWAEPPNSAPGSAIVGKPAAVSWGPNRIDVAATGTNNEIWLKSYQDGVWYGWQSLGGNVPSDASPAIASGAVNTLNVYARGGNGGLWLKSWANNAWTAWDEIGGRPVGDPAAFTQSNGKAHVIARIFNNTYHGIWHRYWQ